MQHIVKRAGHSEAFEEKKLYASIFSICRAIRESVATSELIAEKVVADVNDWIKNKHEVTSHDIRRQASASLELYNQDAAFLYKHHRNLH